MLQLSQVMVPELFKELMIDVKDSMIEASMLHLNPKQMNLQK